MTAPETRSLEHRMGDWARARLPFAVAELAMFILKQGWACLFGGLLLAHHEQEHGGLLAARQVVRIRTRHFLSPNS